MKLWIKGIIVASAGLAMVTLVVYLLTLQPRDFWMDVVITTIGTLMSFAAWLFVISGVSSLREVRKDRRARK